MDIGLTLSRIRINKYASIVAFDGFLVVISLWLAFLLQFNAVWPDAILGSGWLFILAPLVVAVVFAGMGIYAVVPVYVSTKTFTKIAIGLFLHSMILFAVAFVLGIRGVPISLFAIQYFVVTSLLGASRVALRAILRRRAADKSTVSKVAIYGAGSAGVELAEALQAGVEVEPVAFVDDKHALHGNILRGLKVFPTQQLAELIKKYSITQVYLSIPSAPKSRQREVLESLSRLPVKVKSVPDLLDIVSGHSKVDDLKELTVEDMLGRKPVPPNEALLAECIKGKSVMVTGAGGSIGSELCRQIIKLAPTHLVLFEMSEYALYKIEQELQEYRKFSASVLPDTTVIPILGSVLDEKRMESVLKTFSIQTLYHAAAYKHVPMVEYNPIEGVRNNTIGTWHAAKTSALAKVETFVFISTDKAVRPTNVMGATKRMAELVVQGMAEQMREARFSIVRFGNVLGSSGSVVPLFKQQIINGGPITLTHPDMTRYFMTIPEAAQLVIQAGSMAGGGKGGDVFVLDMGVPVNIKDLARSMISLSGLSIRDQEHPYGDISIETTNMRPGEKLYEELMLGGNVSKTQHPRIMRVHEAGLPWVDVLGILDELSYHCERNDAESLLKTLKDAVEGYAPQGGIVDKVWLTAQKKAAVKFSIESMVNG